MLVLIYNALLIAKKQNKGKTVYYVNSNAGAFNTTRFILWSTDNGADRAYVINEAYADHTETHRVSYLAGQKFYITEDKLGNLDSTYLTTTQELIIKTLLRSP